ncbi:unnamed protein product [Caenorhabditis brenneri]
MIPSKLCSALVLIFVPITTSELSFLSSSPNHTLPECTPWQRGHDQWVCHQYVENLTSVAKKFYEIVYEEKVFHDDLNHTVIVGVNGHRNFKLFENVTKICGDIKDCHNKTNCSEADIRMKVYDEMCTKIEFDRYEMFPCLSNIFHEIYKGSYNCSSDYDYFSEDSEIKRKAYTSGKSCFMEIAEINCNSNSKTFLNDNDQYKKLVDLITIPSVNEKRGSIHDRILGMQCEPEHGELISKTYNSHFREIFDEEHRNETLEKCGRLQNCMTTSCYFAEDFTKYTNEICDLRAPNSTTPLRNFVACYFHLELHRSKMDNYNCTLPTFDLLSTQDVQQEKDCLKTVMEKECRSRALWNFDEDWEALLNGTAISRDSAY